MIRSYSNVHSIFTIVIRDEILAKVVQANSTVVPAPHVPTLRARVRGVAIDCLMAVGTHLSEILY